MTEGWDRRERQHRTTSPRSEEEDRNLTTDHGGTGTEKGKGLAVVQRVEVYAKLGWLGSGAMDGGGGGESPRAPRSEEIAKSARTAKIAEIGRGRPEICTTETRIEIGN